MFKANHTEEAIEFTQDRTFAKFWDSSYKGQVEGIYQSAGQIARSADEFMPEMRAR
ncbi:MAG: hypothetical protein HY644_03905 [Acidobacteria bacterium]|nr:hypothetical protein [Acidobacteriota bacterium]